MATLRRKAKTAAKRARARRSATKKKSTKKRSTKNRSTKNRSTRKPKAKRRTTARAKRTVKKSAAKKGRARKTRTTAARPRATATPRPRTPAPSPTGVAPAPSVESEGVEAFVAPAAVPAAPAAGLAGDVAEQLRKRGYDPSNPTVVAVLTDIAEGYRQGPAHAPAWLHVDVDGPIAAGVVERFATGDRAHDVDRSTHRPQVRATVASNLALLAPHESIGDAERDVLTSFCLGSWDPAMNANAERDGIATFVVPWYLAGRSRPARADQARGTMPFEAR